MNTIYLIPSIENECLSANEKSPRRSSTQCPETNTLLFTQGTQSQERQEDQRHLGSSSTYTVLPQNDHEAPISTVS